MSKSEVKRLNIQNGRPMMESSRYRKKYGAWARNTNGDRPNYERCAKEVCHGFHFAQCSRKRGYGPDEAFCKQHAKALEDSA